MIKALAAVALLVVLTGSAEAQVDPRCSTMQDKVACTCAVQNGGWVNNGRWSTKRRNSDPVNEGYYRCLKKAGRG